MAFPARGLDKRWLDKDCAIRLEAKTYDPTHCESARFSRGAVSSTHALRRLWLSTTEEDG